MPETLWPQHFEALLRDQLQFLSPGEPIPPDRSLFEMGLDSLGAVTLLVSIEDNFAVAFEDEVLDAELFATAGSLWKVVDRLRT
jgi:acyl carrier protein